jgi:methylated-DNA-[protein]-cysteine S-methyltransferase
MTPVYFSDCETPWGPIRLAATDEGACHITVPGEPFDVLLTWLERQIPDADLIADPDPLAPVQAALLEFFDGEPLAPVDVDLRGTPFQRAVWQAVMRIPYGETRSYKEIAVMIGRPLAPRGVGAANAVCPLPFIVPCHRVLGADGSIKGFSGAGVLTRRLLLDLEGVKAREA